MMMKRITVGLAVFVFAWVAVFAAPEKKASQVAVKKTAKAPVVVDPIEKWTIFQIGFWLDVPGSTKRSNVFGIKTGQPISSGDGRVFGLEASWLWTGTSTIRGGQACFVGCQSKVLEGGQCAFAVCLSDEIYGLQASTGVCKTEKLLEGAQLGGIMLAGDVYGLQASAVGIAQNVEGCQTAAAFARAMDVTGLQACCGVNMARDVTGAQMSFINMGNNMTGMQAGFVNTLEGRSDGVQFGFINVSKKSGVQFGFLNFIADGWVPCLPICNVKF